MAPPTWRRTSDIHAFGAWVDAFMEAVGVDEPAVVIGHSFGGGVSITLAHDHPGAGHANSCSVNSVGGAVWGRGDRQLSDRMLWQWGYEFAKEAVAAAQRPSASLWTVREDFISNVLRNPRAMLRPACSRARPTSAIELAELRARKLPVVVMSGEADGVIPLSAFDAMCGALGIEGQVLPGNHSWLLADPDAFDEVMANVVELQSTLEGD